MQCQILDIFSINLSLDFSPLTRDQKARPEKDIIYGSEAGTALISQVSTGITLKSKSPKQRNSVVYHKR